MDNKIEVKFLPEEIKKIEDLDKQIREKKMELKNYIRELEFNYKLNETKLCLLTYKKAVEVDKDKREYLGSRKYELKEFVRLAYISWVPFNSLIGLRASFCSVPSNNKKYGNAIYLHDLEDVSYEILDGYTVEEAKKLLKKNKER